MDRKQRARAVIVTSGALVALLAMPAAAHPFVRGGVAPVDSLASVTLAMAHGCGSEDAAGGNPTTEVSMEVPDGVRIVTAGSIDGYEVVLERDGSGAVEVVTWTATGAGVAAPEVPFDAVFEGSVGDEIYLKVFQGCDGFAYRWIGTPDEPADDPAVSIRLEDADPDRPAPEPEEQPQPDAPSSDEPGPASEEPNPGDGADPGPDTTVDDGMTDPDGATDGDGGVDAPVASGQSGEASAGSSGLSPWVLVAFVGAVVAGATVAWVRRAGGRRRA